MNSSTVEVRAEANPAPASRSAGRRGVLIRVGRTLAVLGAVGGVAVTSAPSASAAEINVLRNWQNGRCLDSNDRGEVYTNPCQDGNQYQQWRMHVEGSGGGGRDVARIMNVATGLVLQSDGVNPITGPWRDNDWNSWAGDGPDWQHVKLVARAGYENSCLTSSAGGAVWLQGCNGDGSQDWKFGF